MEHKIAVVLLLVIAVFAVVGLYMISAEPKVVTQTVPVNVPVVQHKTTDTGVVSFTIKQKEDDMPIKAPVSRYATGAATFEIKK